MEPEYQLSLSRGEAQAVLTAVAKNSIESHLALFQKILGQLQAQEKAELLKAGGTHAE